MPLRLYNTLARAKEEFVPLRPGEVSFYSCGPTVYGEFHVGNGRTFVSMDVVRRWLLASGYKVRYVQNITDVDDKIIDRARAEGTTPEAIAAKYTDYFLTRLALLGILPADLHPRATGHIDGMVRLVSTLLERGHAYTTDDGSAWFEVATFPGHGKLSRMPLDQMRQGERVDQRLLAMKRSPRDFALWKGSKPGEPSWPAPWGAGRPGWHIECTCMVMDTFKSPTIDIHGGGSDLIFPHHENEIAQGEAATGEPFVRYWIHAGMLDIDGEKMSKSLGNFRVVDDFLQAVSPLALRYFLISARYRDKLDLTDDNLHRCSSAAERLSSTTIEAERVLGAVAPLREQADPVLHALEREFTEAMDDDINTPGALGAMAKTVTLLNTRRVAGERGDNAELEGARAALGLLGWMRETLGLGPALEKVSTPTGDDPELVAAAREIAASVGAPTEGSLDSLVQGLVARRAQARKEKQFAVSDAVRARLLAAGIVLEDKPGGVTTWKIARPELAKS